MSGELPGSRIWELRRVPGELPGSRIWELRRVAGGPPKQPSREAFPHAMVEMAIFREDLREYLPEYLGDPIDKTRSSPKTGDRS